ncbi:MAG TPA: hypothetical protein VF412_12975 [Bdellovibrio sp.]|uniref:hypothetical protein n=1 Tax=Bdellovibrio sp. TaxID=28201 RepID=UPI002F20FCB6
MRFVMLMMIILVGAFEITGMTELRVQNNPPVIQEESPHQASSLMDKIRRRKLLTILQGIEISIA